MNLLQALIAQVQYLITGDAELKKQINKSDGWKQRQSITKQIAGTSHNISEKVKDTVHDIDYEGQRKHIKDLAHEKEKDLQKQVKKLQSYADSLGEKKLKEIVDDIQSSSEAFVDKIQDKATAVAKSAQASVKKVVKKTPIKKASTAKKPTKKAPAKKTSPRSTATTTAKKK
jgi:hypothetical protein